MSAPAPSSVRCIGHSSLSTRSAEIASKPKPRRPSESAYSAASRESVGKPVRYSAVPNLSSQPVRSRRKSASASFSACGARLEISISRPSAQARVYEQRETPECFGRHRVERGAFRSYVRGRVDVRPRVRAERDVRGAEAARFEPFYLRRHVSWEALHSRRYRAAEVYDFQNFRSFMLFLRSLSRLCITYGLYSIIKKFLRGYTALGESSMIKLLFAFLALVFAAVPAPRRRAAGDGVRRRGDRGAGLRRQRGLRFRRRGL